jgi:hypothetical protein
MSVIPGVLAAREQLTRDQWSGEILGAHEHIDVTLQGSVTHHWRWQRRGIFSCTHHSDSLAHLKLLKTCRLEKVQIIHSLHQKGSSSRYKGRAAD